MKSKYGILLLEKNEIIVRIYEAGDNEWKLLYYHSIDLPLQGLTTSKQETTIIEAIAQLLVSDYAQHVSEWRTFARNLPDHLIQAVSSSVDFPIENLIPLREQELLCKGMFTELW